MALAYRYDPEQNPAGEYIPGVPLRDLTTEDMEALDAYLAGGVEQCAFYVPVAARVARATLPKPSETKGAGDAETK